MRFLRACRVIKRGMGQPSLFNADAVVEELIRHGKKIEDARDGGTYHIDMLPTTCHVYFGSVTGATPDGRSAREVQSEGISPAHSADRYGPTGVLMSTSKMDHQQNRTQRLQLKAKKPPY